MRPLALTVCLILTLLVPKVGKAQITYRPTPPPEVTYAAAEWRTNGEPIFYAGSLYYPTGPNQFFDGKLMVQTGEYLGVPLYTDTTLEAFSVVYVPIGGTRMKPYERRRDGDLAGTVGSRPPSWPVRHPSTAEASGRAALDSIRAGAPVVLPDADRITGIVADAPPVTAAVAGTAGSALPPFTPTTVQSVRRPTTNAGLSITFSGERWYSNGPAVSFTSSQFAPVGDYHGFPVFRDGQGDPDTIYVTVVEGGSLAPYSRR